MRAARHGIKDVRKGVPGRTEHISIKCQGRLVATRRSGKADRGRREGEGPGTEVALLKDTAVAIRDDCSRDGRGYVGCRTSASGQIRSGKLERNIPGKI